MKSRIDYNRPTAMMLGRWQPWHKGHQELFKKVLERVVQVIIYALVIYLGLVIISKISDKRKRER